MCRTVLTTERFTEVTWMPVCLDELMLLADGKTNQLNHFFCQYTLFTVYICCYLHFKLTTIRPQLHCLIAIPLQVIWTWKRETAWYKPKVRVTYYLPRKYFKNSIVSGSICDLIDNGKREGPSEKWGVKPGLGRSFLPCVCVCVSACTCARSRVDILMKMIIISSKSLYTV